ncbi:MAG: endo-1,4-beta-xylanase [Myxococcota bacterium]
MRTNSLALLVLAVCLEIQGCSAGNGGGPDTAQGGKINPAGGGPAQGGGSNNQGGSNTPQGGASNGGTPSTGGTASGGSSQGGSQAGGQSSSGGAQSGGTNTSGGSQGGSSTGGRSTTGGTTGAGGSKGGATGAGGTTTAGGTTSSSGGSTTQPGKKFVGNITTGNSVDTNGLVFAKYWDQITPENAGKWGSVQSSASAAFNWGTLDAIYDYTKKNGIIFKQHAFVWGNQQPSGSLSEANVKTWISEFCKRYPETKLIDVVNEPPPHTTPSYANAIGGGTNGDWKWITNAFTWARAACPNAILILNDYNNIEWDAEHKHFIDIVKKVKAAGAPVDAVGCQAHDVYRKTNTEIQTMLNNINAQTGLPVYITEYDVSDTNDDNQLKIYQQQFPIFWNTEYIKGITIWGWIYGRTWSQAPNSGLVNNGKSRKAMTWLMQQLGRSAP